MEAVLEIARNRGYRRIGFITNDEGEKRAGRLWSGGFLEFQSRCISVDARVPLLRLNAQAAEFSGKENKQIDRWYRENHPDVIISFLNKTQHCLKSLGIRSPEDVLHFLAMVERVGGLPVTDKTLKRLGAVAVDIVVDRLLQNNRGVPDYPSSTLLTGEFMEGGTLRGSTA